MSSAETLTTGWMMQSGINIPPTEVSILSPSMIFLLDFGNVQTMWLFLFFILKIQIKC